MTHHTPLPGPGWHPDPHQPARLRYWDGRAWTQHTSPVPATPHPKATQRQPRSRTYVIVAAVVLLAMIGIGALGEDESADEVTASSATEVAGGDATTAPDTSDDLSAEAEVADVPALTGVDQVAAERKLARAGLAVGRVSKVWSMRPSGTVLEQEMRAGAAAAVGTAVALVIAKAIPSVPGTAGRLRSVAVDALEAAGYRVAVSTQTVTSGTDGAVLRQSPVGGTRVKPGGIIRLVVANVVRPVAQAPEPSSCAPGYDPCLTPMSDYDCTGGSGDGPGYTGTVRVTGSDPYQLDSDGDGIACDS